ncbi:hypothetical protein STIAU_7336 [Stigmatella aurantiaca DW4/3-1]|uniref:Uncharacterized protein n=1 Tax=Stigmatella aurantiaca (strain DW4/3-1) TaxID=378806 RepID=Q08Y41_STIAD|nr:hypothetical protein STIAU_7336 [Stigmatella aurantiaca DW4/3-1]
MPIEGGGAILHHLLGTERGACPKHDASLGNMARRFIRHGHHGHFRDGLVRQEVRFDLAGVDLEPTPGEHVVLPAHIIEIPVLIGPEQIAGEENPLLAEQIVLEHLRRLLWQVPVPQHHKIPSDRELPSPAWLGDQLAIVIDQKGTDARDGLAHGAWPLVNLRGGEIGNTLALGQSVVREDLDLRKRAPQTADVLERQGLPTAGDIPEGFDALRLKIFDLANMEYHRRKHLHAGHFFAADHLEDLLWLLGDLLFHNRPAPEKQWHQDVVKAVVRGQGRIAQDGIIGCIFQIPCHGLEGGDHVLVADQHPFGPRT